MIADSDRTVVTSTVHAWTDPYRLFSLHLLGLA